MILIADRKRRVVLLHPAEPGDAFQCLEVGERFVLVRLKPPPARRPPVAPTPLKATVLKGVDLDAPAFAPLADEGRGSLSDTSPTWTERERDHGVVNRRQLG
jgi:hypothetical protein